MFQMTYYSDVKWQILTNIDDIVSCLFTEFSKNFSAAGVRYNSSATDNQYCSNKDIELNNISFSVGDVKKILLSQVILHRA